MAQPFGTAMDCKVFGARCRLEISWVITLEPPHEGHSQSRRQVWIFSISLLPSAPPRIAKDVDVWCPERQSTVLKMISFFGGHVVVGAGLIRDRGGDSKYEVFVKRSAETDCLGKDRSNAGTTNTMKCLVPPIVCGNIQSGNRRTAMHHLEGLFLQSQSC